jgi:hypothetical protein
VAFQPVTDPTFDMHLPNSLSHRANDLKDLQKTVGSIVAGEIGPRDDPEARQILARHVGALEGRLASDRMVDVLEAAGYLSQLPQAQPRSRRARARTHLALRTLVKTVNRYRPGHRNNLAFHRHRFPGVTAAELQAKIEGLQDQLGRFAGLRAKPIARHLFTIEK